MSKEKRTITNESGTKLILMIDPTQTLQHFYRSVTWPVSPSQWSRIVAASDSSPWETEKGAFIDFDCPPMVAGCLYPGRN